jgi:hypothetical protein
MESLSRSVFCFIALLCSLTLLGCSGNASKAVPSGGVLKTSKGEPCAGALIVLHPQEKARVNDPKPVATADANGNFVLRTHTQDDGADPGEYGVTVVWLGSEAGVKEFSLSSESGGGATDRLGGRYGNPKDPKIKVTIPANGDKSLDIKVE